MSTYQHVYFVSYAHKRPKGKTKTMEPAFGRAEFTMKDVITHADALNSIEIWLAKNGVIEPVVLFFAPLRAIPVLDETSAEASKSTPG